MGVPCRCPRTPVVETSFHYGAGILFRTDSRILGPNFFYHFTKFNPPVKEKKSEKMRQQAGLRPAC